MNRIIITSLFILACNGYEEDSFKHCITDRYATYNTLEQCFQDQCAEPGEYLFRFFLKNSTCKDPYLKFEFKDYIFTDNHPLRFLSFCGYNQVIIDETYGRGEPAPDGLVSHIYEGQFIDNVFHGKHVRNYEKCKDVYEIKGER